MTTGGWLQLMLVLGVFVPLASFVYLAFRGHRLGRRRDADPKPAARDDHAHDEHGPPGPGERTAGWVATAAIGSSLVLSLLVTLIWAGMGDDARSAATTAAQTGGWLWLNLGDVPIHFRVNLDSLTVITYLMVTICSTCIHVFSIGYMTGDVRYSRFFCYLSLFCFSMLGLVISENLLFLFVFWELVGLCSYFLIGHWFEKRSASNAAIKAFVTNKVGDFGFMVGLALCFVYLGTLSLSEASTTFLSGAQEAGWLAETSAPIGTVTAGAAESAASLFNVRFWGFALATWLGIGLFCGAVGKSAQFPLHVWLPDAMEGPTPVSALIHAATMVAAGVYLVARVFLLLTPGALHVITIIGAITLTIAALLAIVQTDIKRVLAYSTLSQLGYMIFGLGIGAWIGALFHLLTHAFFKALLFLGSGSVIAGCHHEQDMRRMGGLWLKMPGTALTFLIAVLAISGAGIPWTDFGIGGFYSKDEILAVAHYRHYGVTEAGEHLPQADHADAATGGGVALVAQAHAAPDETAVAPADDAETDAPLDPEQVHPPALAKYADAATQDLGWLWFWLPVIIAYITPFYMGRCFVLTFLGKPRDEHLHEHARESQIMVGPLLVLAAMTIVSGVFLFRPLVSAAAPGKDAGLAAAIDGLDHALHTAHMQLPIMVGFAFVVGLAAAWLLYRNGFALAERIAALPVVRPIHRLLVNRYYIDHVYDFVFVRGVRVVLAGLSRLFDRIIIDGTVNTLAYLTTRSARFTGRVLDNAGVDGLVNGVGRLCWGIGRAFSQMQLGAIRGYIALTATAVAAILLSLWSPSFAIAIVILAITIYTRNLWLLFAAVVIVAIVAAWQQNPTVAGVLLTLAILSLIPLGRRYLPASER